MISMRHLLMKSLECLDRCIRESFNDAEEVNAPSPRKMLMRSLGTDDKRSNIRGKELIMLQK